MHKFTRGNAPVNMEASARRSNSSWNEFARSEEHYQLGQALYERQNGYCAYCEIKLNGKDRGHIEHLDRRSDNPGRAFDWCNMFFSCNTTERCGHYKDYTHQCYRPEDIVDPSTEDPMDFFNYDMEGNIVPKENPETRFRASETIRVFNLNEPKIKETRANIARIVTCILDCETDEVIDEFLASLTDPDCISVYYSLCDRKIP